MAYGNRTRAKRRGGLASTEEQETHFFVRTDSHRQAALLSSSCFCKNPIGSRVSHRVPLSTEIGIHEHHSHRMSVTSLWEGASTRTQTRASGNRGPARTYAGGDGRAALLVAFGAAVAGDAGHTVLAGTLAGGLVAGFASSAHRVAIAGCGGHTTGRSAGWAEEAGAHPPQVPPHPVAPHRCHPGEEQGWGSRPSQAHTHSRNSDNWPPAYLETGKENHNGLT